MSKNTFSKVWLITVIALVTLFTSVSIVAYWPIMVNPPEGGSKGTTIQIGSGGTVTTVLSELNRVGDLSKELIPDHHTLTPRAHQTKKLEYEFDIIWSEDEHGLGASEGSAYKGDLSLNSFVEYVDAPSYLTPENKEAIKLIKVSFYLVEINEGVKTLTLIEDKTSIEILYQEQFTILVVVKLDMPPEYVDYVGVKGNEFKITVRLIVDDVAEVENEKD